MKKLIILALLLTGCEKVVTGPLPDWLQARANDRCGRVDIDGVTCVFCDGSPISNLTCDWDAYGAVSLPDIGNTTLSDCGPGNNYCGAYWP